MNWMSLLIGILPSLLQLAPQIIAAWNTPTNQGIAKVTAVIQKTNLAPVLAQIGAAVFPKLAPELQAAAAALIHAHPNNTSYAQEALNLIQSTGYMKFGVPLVVDGLWGPKTMAAVEALQTKLGLPVNGFLADAEYQAIGGLLAKIG